MSHRTLKVHPDTNQSSRERELDRITGVAEAKTVAVPISKIVPLLMDATSNDRAWLSDFADDLVRIDSDLYEVLIAYQQFRERGAA
jgi:hypothetical protein